MNKLYKGLLAIFCVASAGQVASAARFIFNTTTNNDLYKYVWSWKTGTGTEKMITSSNCHDIRVYPLESDADNIIFTSASTQSGLNDSNKGGEYLNVPDLAVFANADFKGILTVRGNFTGSWANYDLSYVSGSTYKTQSFTMGATAPEFTICAGQNGGETVGFGASSGILSHDGATTHWGGWTNSNAKVQLAQGSVYYLTVNAGNGDINLVVVGGGSGADTVSSTFNLNNIDYVHPDFGGNPEPFRTLTSQVDMYNPNVDYKTYQRSRMLLAVNQKENIGFDDLTNQWVKYEDRSMSKESPYYYFYSDDVIEPGDDRYDALLNSEFGDRLDQRNQWALNGNTSDIHTCRNFNNAYYRGYMVAEGATLDDIRHDPEIELFSTATPMSKNDKSGVRRGIRMSLMGNDDNRVARTFYMKDNTSGIEETIDDMNSLAVPEDGETSYYNLQGQRIVRPAEGQVYIVRRGHEATKEVYVK